MDISIDELKNYRCPNGGYSDYLFYSTVVMNDKTTCGICQMDEEYDKEIWHRNVLACGHKFHTRCFRKWMDYKKRTICPFCGDMENDKKNMYCQICKKFGHVDRDCHKTVEDIINEAYGERIRKPRRERHRVILVK